MVVSERQQLRNTLRPVWWFVLPLVLMIVWRGSLPALIYPGDRVTWKVLAEYSWNPITTQSGSFFCIAASSTPIRVVTEEVRYIYELSLTLEHSMPISSPAAPGLTPCALIWHKTKHFQNSFFTFETRDKIAKKKLRREEKKLIILPTTKNDFTVCQKSTRQNMFLPCIIFLPCVHTANSIFAVRSIESTRETTE